MTMQIRRYQGSDHDQVLCLHRVALAAIGADAGPSPWDDDLEQIEQSYLTVRGDFLVGILDDRVAAMGALRHIDQQTAELKRMRVSLSLNNKVSVAGSCTPWKPAPGNSAISPWSWTPTTSRRPPSALPNRGLSRDQERRTR